MSEPDTVEAYIARKLAEAMGPGWCGFCGARDLAPGATWCPDDRHVHGPFRMEVLRGFDGLL